MLKFSFIKNTKKFLYIENGKYFEIFRNIQIFGHGIPGMNELFNRHVLKLPFYYSI